MTIKSSTADITEAQEPSSHFGLERVVDEGSLVHEWYPLLTEIFTDPNDLEDIPTLLERFYDSDKNVFSMLRNSKGEPMGIRLMQLHPDVPEGMYIPWGGVTADYRNHGIYPKLVTETLQQMSTMGVRYTLHDFEDPARIATAYPDEPAEEAEKRAAKRLNFFRRSLDCLIVDDKDIPYIRPASDDPTQVQAYDLLAISFADKNDPLRKEALSADGKSMRKSFYREKYIEMAVLQYGSMSEEGLKETYPAIKEFLDVLDKSPKEWVNVYRPEISPKLKADLPLKIHTQSFQNGPPAQP